MITLVCFLTTQSMWGAPSAGIEMAGSRELPAYLSIDVPVELGTVDALYEAPAGANPQFILHIQNAHANYQAQMKIKQLLQYMNKKYGFKTIFVEGASEKLNADYLRLFPDQERNLKLCDELAKQGELTGVELFLMEQGTESGAWSPESGIKNTGKGSALNHVSGLHRPSNAVEALGIEEAVLYKANYDALKKVFGAETDVNRFFQGFDAKLDHVASKTFSPETRGLIADWKRFEQGRRDFMPFVKGLAKKSKKIMNVDLECLFAQVGWPQISRLLVIQQMEKNVNKTKGVEEQFALLKDLRTKGVSKELLATLENFTEGTIAVGKATHEVSPREILERLASEAEPKGFKFSDYPAFSLYAGYVTLRSELDPKTLYEEIEYLFMQMLDTLAKEPQQKALLALYRDGELLRKLLHLELNRTQWRQAVEAKERIAVPSLVSRLKDAVIASGDAAVRKDQQVMPKAFSGKMDELFTAGLEFYDYAHKREAVFYKEMQTAMTERKITKAILITGGFHTDGMSDLFRENAISYGIVTPRLSEKSDERFYRTTMLQDRKHLFSVSYLEMASKLMRDAALAAQGIRLGQVYAVIFNAMMKAGTTDIDAVATFNRSELAKRKHISLVRKTDARGRPIKDRYRIVRTMDEISPNILPQVVRTSTTVPPRFDANQLDKNQIVNILLPRGPDGKKLAPNTKVEARVVSRRDDGVIFQIMGSVGGEYYFSVLKWKITQPIVVKAVKITQDAVNGFFEKLHNLLNWSWLGTINFNWLNGGGDTRLNGARTLIRNDELIGRVFPGGQARETNVQWLSALFGTATALGGAVLTVPALVATWPLFFTVIGVWAVLGFIGYRVFPRLINRILDFVYRLTYRKEIGAREQAQSDSMVSEVGTRFEVRPQMTMSSENLRDVVTQVRKDLRLAAEKGNVSQLHVAWNEDLKQMEIREATLNSKNVLSVTNVERTVLYTDKDNEENFVFRHYWGKQTIPQVLNIPAYPDLAGFKSLDELLKNKKFLISNPNTLPLEVREALFRPGAKVDYQQISVQPPVIRSEVRMFKDADVEDILDGKQTISSIGEVWDLVHAFGLTTSLSPETDDERVVTIYTKFGSREVRIIPHIDGTASGLTVFLGDKSTSRGKKFEFPVLEKNSDITKVLGDIFQRFYYGIPARSTRSAMGDLIKLAKTGVVPAINPEMSLRPNIGQTVLLQMDDRQYWVGKLMSVKDDTFLTILPLNGVYPESEMGLPFRLSENEHGNAPVLTGVRRTVQTAEVEVTKENLMRGELELPGGFVLNLQKIYGAVVGIRGPGKVTQTFLPVTGDVRGYLDKLYSEAVLPKVILVFGPEALELPARSEARKLIAVEQKVTPQAGAGDTLAGKKYDKLGIPDVWAQFEKDMGVYQYGPGTGREMLVQFTDGTIKKLTFSHHAGLAIVFKEDLLNQVSRYDIESIEILARSEVRKDFTAKARTEFIASLENYYGKGNVWITVGEIKDGRPQEIILKVRVPEQGRVGPLDAEKNLKRMGSQVIGPAYGYTIDFEYGMPFVRIEIPQNEDAYGFRDVSMRLEPLSAAVARVTKNVQSPVEPFANSVLRDLPKMTNDPNAWKAIGFLVGEFANLFRSPDYLPSLPGRRLIEKKLNVVGKIENAETAKNAMNVITALSPNTFSPTSPWTMVFPAAQKSGFWDANGRLQISRSEVRPKEVEERQTFAKKVWTFLTSTAKNRVIQTKFIISCRHLENLFGQVVVPAGDPKFLTVPKVAMMLEVLVALKAGELNWNKFLQLVKTIMANKIMAVSDTVGGTVITMTDLPSDAEWDSVALLLGMNPHVLIRFVVINDQLSRAQKDVAKQRVSEIRKMRDHQEKEIGNDRIDIKFEQSAKAVEAVREVSIEVSGKLRKLDSTHALKSGEHLSILIQNMPELLGHEFIGTQVESRKGDKKLAPVRNLIAVKTAQLNVTDKNMSAMMLLNKQVGDNVLQFVRRRTVSYFGIDEKKLAGLLELWSSMMLTREATSVAA